MLTEAGKILLSHSKRVFYELEQAQAALKDLDGLERGELRVGSLLTCIDYLLSPAIIHFKKFLPKY